MELVAGSSLQRKLVIAFVVALLIPALVLAIYHLVEMRSLLLAQSGLEYRQRAEMRAAVAEELVASAVTDLLAVARSPSMLYHANAPFASNDPLLAELAAFLHQARAPYQALCVFAITAAEQVCLRSPFPDDTSAWAPVVEPAPATVALAAREALAGGTQAGTWQFRIVPLEVSPPGALVVALVTVVARESGEPAVLTLELPAQELFEALVAPEAPVSTTIVDASGTYLFQSVAGQPGGLGAPTLLASRPRDASWVLGQAGSVAFPSADRPQTLQVAVPVRPPGQSGLEWTVIYALPRSAITDPIWRSEVMIAIITLSALLVALVVAMRLAHDIVRPVRALAAAAERVGNGDLHATIPTGGNDEIGALGRTFDRTVARLRDAIAATESRRQEAETLRAATQAVSSTLDLNQVLDLILSELRKVVPYD
ncbi:MAG: HAMP domain-containing protein, partial [Chloroflexaceae bacterium]|nr:HAMP domain-containing protein [Chloroflexaceae bacterium]